MKKRIKIEEMSLCTGEGYYNRFFRLPQSVVDHFLVNSKHEMSEFEAFLQMIMKVNYNDDLSYKSRVCRRGESYQSLGTWANHFNWSRSRTVRFFKKLFDNNVIEYEGLKDTTRVRLKNYDYYVGRAVSESGKEFTDEFEEFWLEYHRVMAIRATDKLAAFREYKKLTIEEREKAFKMIRRFFYNQENVKLLTKAVNYLANKRFNDQFLC